jgi:hypothetical protein
MAHSQETALTLELPLDASAQTRLQQRQARWMGICTFILVLVAFALLR